MRIYKRLLRDIWGLNKSKAQYNLDWLGNFTIHHTKKEAIYYKVL